MRKLSCSKDTTAFVCFGCVTVEAFASFFYWSFLQDFLLFIGSSQRFVYVMREVLIVIFTKVFMVIVFL